MIVSVLSSVTYEGKMEIEEALKMDENELSNFTGFPIPATVSVKH